MSVHCDDRLHLAYTQTYLRSPTEQAARQIVEVVLQRPVGSVQRFPTGLCHYVYDVVLEDQQRVVARIAQPDTQALLVGGVFWSHMLRPLGVPLPRVLYADLDAAHAPFAFVLLERLPGTDLAHVYSRLSRHARHTLAADLVRIQQLVHGLPARNGFGYATSLDDVLPYHTWTALVEHTLLDSQQQIVRAGVVDPRHVERVQQRLARFGPYLDQVAPTPFLDDTTTKNVLVDNDRLTGIVDVDEVCYGDPLWVVALTQMALLKQGADLDYIAAWSDLLQLSAEQRRVLHFYTAVFCTNFLGELGQVFNKHQAEPVDAALVQHLTQILDDLLAAC